MNFSFVFFSSVHILFTTIPKEYFQVHRRDVKLFSHHYEKTISDDIRNVSTEKYLYSSYR